MTRQEICDELCIEEPVMFPAPECLDEAIVGITEDKCHLIYNYSCLVAAFAADFAKTDGGVLDDYLDEAVEWIDCNTLRSLPFQDQSIVLIIMYPLFREEESESKN